MVEPRKENVVLGTGRQEPSLVKWFRDEKDEKDVFDYVLDLTDLYDYAPGAPVEEEDIENLINGVEMLVRAFGYRAKRYVTIATDGCDSNDYVEYVEKELADLEKEGCDALLLVKEYDNYVFCLSEYLTRGK